MTDRLGAVRLKTDRLLIRHWRQEEAARPLNILGCVQVMRWLGDVEPVLLKTLDEGRP